MKKRSLSYAFMIFFITLLLLPTQKLSAYNGSLKVIENINPLAASSQIELMLENFDLIRHNFYAGEDTSELTTVPTSAFGGSCLRIGSTGTGTRRTAAYSPDMPLNLSDYGCLFIAVKLPDTKGGNFKFGLSMSSGSNIYTATVELPGGGWHGIFADISGFNNRSDIMQLNISCEKGSAAGATDDFAFYIDSIGLCASPNADRAVRYLTPDYYANGARLTVYDDYLQLIVTDENPSIESYTLNNTVLTEANSIALKYQSSSPLTAVKLFYTTPTDPSFSDARSFTIDPENGVVQTCYFPVVNAEQIKLVFEGANSGSINIYSLAPASAYVSDKQSGGALTSCIITDNLREITITGRLNTETATRLKGVRLNLYELGVNQTVEEIINGSNQPIFHLRAEEELRIRIPLTEGKSSRLCSSFIVGAEIGGSVIFIGSPIYITNPEILAKPRWSPPEIKIKKGMATSPTDAQSLGIKNTVITVNLEKVLTLDESGIKYTTYDSDFYFNRLAITALDTEVKGYSDAAINITLLLTVSQSGDSAIDKLLLYPNSDKTANYNAFNTDTAEGVLCLRAVTEFLASRYSGEKGRVSGYIVGFEVQDSENNYSSGKTRTVDDYAALYSKAFRVIYNSVRAVAGEVSVYISLGNGWDSRLPSLYASKYSNRQLIDVISARISDEGNIRWSLAYNPNATPGLLYMPQNDTSATDSFDAPTITPRSIEALCAYMNRPIMTYGGQGRAIMLLDLTPPLQLSEMERINWAASYVYTYYKINTRNCSLIESYVIALHDDYNDLIKHIDSNLSLDYSAFALPLLGVAEWNGIIDDFSALNVERRTYQSGLIDSSRPDGITGSFDLWSFANSESGWFAADNCFDVTFGNYLYGRNNLMMANLSSAPKGEFSAIANNFSYALDLSDSPIFSFDLQLAMLPNGITDIDLCVLLYSGDSVFESTGKITAGNWNTVVLDMSDFVGLKRADRMKLWFKEKGGADLSGTIIIISEISALSQTKSSETLAGGFAKQQAKYLALSKRNINMKLVWALIIVIISAISVGVINRLYMRDKSYKKDIDISTLFKK